MSREGEQREPEDETLVARRRAERSVVTLGRAEAVGEPVRRYLNRLSDLLFVMGRKLNKSAGRGDVLWRHVRTKRKA